MKLILVLGAICAVLSQDVPPPPAGGEFGGGVPDWYCRLLNSEDCMDHLMDQRCGTDGVTYYNQCDLGQAFCNDSDIHQQSVGPCDAASALTTPAHVGNNMSGSGNLVDKSTTPAPEGLVHGSEVILDFQCLMLSHSPCQHTISEIICGTDGRTYDSFCEYEKARCTHRDLHVAGTGACKSS